MTLLLDIAPFSPPVTPHVTGRDIYRRFEDDPDLLVIADGNSYAERRAVVDRLALMLDAIPVDSLGHYSAGRDFGPIAFRVVAVSDAQ